MVAQTKVNSSAFIASSSLSLYEKLALVLAGSVLLIISAKTMVPFWPVPMTLQPLAVVMLGVALGPRLGFAAAMTYLLQGALGLPVFADSISYPGLAVLVKPSAGFLLSFPLTAFAAGWLTERGWTQGWMKSIALFAFTYSIMYSMGMTWFSSMLGLELAFQNMLLWLPSDLAKIGLGVTSIQLYQAIKSRS